MARARNVKPGASKNEDLAECSFPARLCFVMLPTIADREGRLEDRPKRIKGELFPFDAIEMDPLLVELDSHGLIARYVVNGQALIQILAFAKHQHPHHKEPDSTLPPCPGLTLDSEGKWVKTEVSGCKPPKAQALTRCNDTKALDKSETSTDLNALKGDLEGGSNPADSGYLIPDTGFRSPEPGMAAATAPDCQTVQAPVATAKPVKANRGARLPAEWVLQKAWGDWAMAKYPHWTAEVVRSIASKFRNHWVAKTGKDATKLDWEATWQNWCDSGITQREHPPPKGAAARDTADRNAKSKRLLGINDQTETVDA